jgi:hypothetical protein
MKRNLFPYVVGIALFALRADAEAQGTGTYVTIIPGPASPVLTTSYNNTGWFPDASFPLIAGGPNAPALNLSWWMNRHEGQTLDTSLASAGGQWIPGGPYGSGDYRGYWIQTVYRPTDFTSNLNGTTTTLSRQSRHGSKHQWHSFNGPGVGLYDHDQC